MDLVGKKFGSLTVVRRVGSNKYGHTLWLTRCDCGRDFEISGSDIKRRKFHRCNSCLHKPVDLTGKRFGSFIVLFMRTGIHGAQTCLCRCDCGKETDVYATNLLKGTISACGCKHPLPKGEAAFNVYFSRLKGRSRDQSFQFLLSKEQVKFLTGQPCFYCGSEPSQLLRNPNGNGGFRYNGLDRVDILKGYSIDNVVPCCGTCNHAKASLSIDEFKNLICKIYQNWAGREDCNASSS